MRRGAERIGPTWGAEDRGFDRDASDLRDARAAADDALGAVAEAIAAGVLHAGHEVAGDPVAADGHGLTLPRLPASVQLSPGRRTIQFDGVEQLLTHVYELSQAAVNDFEGFRLAAEVPR